MTGFWNAIQSLFVDFLFGPYDALRFTDNWWLSNIVSWIFIAIGFAAFAYWMKQLKTFEDNGEEDKSISSHSYI
jgi:H+/Cl- antiporter ClcA